MDEREVIRFLLREGLLTSAHLVDGDVSVRDVSRRNRNFIVRCRAGPSYFVKQVAQPDLYGAGERELTFYRSVSERSELAPSVPEFYGFWPERSVLVLGARAHVRTLGEHQQAGRFSKRLGRTFGRILAWLHAAEPTANDAQYPHGLHLHRPTVTSLRSMSPAAVDLVRLLQRDPHVSELIDATAHGWSRDSMIHGDIKAANCMVIRDARGRGTGLQLVDWENSGQGDRAWDVGSVLGDHASRWLLSISATGVESVERLPTLARFPLARIRPALQAFWDAYTRGIGAIDADRLLLRSTRFAGIRLLQSASEETQFETNLTPHSLLQVQVAVNLMRRPGEAAVRLFGLPLRGVGDDS